MSCEPAACCLPRRLTNTRFVLQIRRLPTDLLPMLTTNDFASVYTRYFGVNFDPRSIFGQLTRANFTNETKE